MDEVNNRAIVSRSASMCAPLHGHIELFARFDIFHRHRGCLKFLSQLVTRRALELRDAFLERINVRGGGQHFELGGIGGIGGGENSGAADEGRRSYEPTIYMGFPPWLAPRSAFSSGLCRNGLPASAVVPKSALIGRWISGWVLPTDGTRTATRSRGRLR